ncbi:MAG TPA: hypothetical protein VFZ51_05770, partial [Woeseiaceae bacterium]
MKNVVLILVFLVFVLCPASASAQIPGCGGVQPKTSIWQSPDYALSITGYTQSTRNIDGCLMKLRVEAWIDGTVSTVAVG